MLLTDGDGGEVLGALSESVHSRRRGAGLPSVGE